ncbi:MAG TPA: YidC/Oxa1 family membrane protein insertase [Solirubrobacterales bacterium]|nr:YidC/Oxa1 family membrane protein insertase [Solirubrobacterales bacterium]
MIPVASILQPLEDAAEAILQLFHDDVGLTWGTSIIALTIVVRALLIPLTYKQIKGMRALQALQPQLKEIQEKYKNDRPRMQQEVMRFYQENKINPLASCLPLLLQIPVFFALFQLLQGDSFERDVEQSGGAGWLFIESVIQNPKGAETIILMLLFAGSMALSTVVTMRSSPTAAGTQQYVLIGAFALIGVFFVPAFPAGLSLYWITTNFWTVGQAYVAAKVIPAPAVLTPDEAAAAKPPPPPPKKKRKKRR